jgi:hypothetical protein
MPPDKGVEIVRADPLIYTWLGTPFSRIITIAISIESDWDGDDSFCGVATFDKPGTGATSIL